MYFSTILAVALAHAEQLTDFQGITWNCR